VDNIERLLAMIPDDQPEPWSFLDDQLIVATVRYCGTTRLGTELERALSAACRRPDVSWRIRNAGTALGFDDATHAAKLTRRVAASLQCLERSDLLEIVCERLNERLLLGRQQ
jgi:hypothetical protein